MTTGRINQVARPRGRPASVVTLRFHLRGKANATTEPVVTFVRALLILHEGRIIGCISYHVIVERQRQDMNPVIAISERASFRIEATRRASSLYRKQHPKPKARARLP